MSRIRPRTLHSGPNEPASAARAMAFNKINVDKFFEILDKVQAENHFNESRIFNVDETGITTVQGTPSKVFALKCS